MTAHDRPATASRRLGAPIAVFLTVAMLAVFTLIRNDPENTLHIGSIASLTATIAAGYAARRQPDHRLSWSLICASMGANTLGDIVYEALLPVNGLAPAISLADLFYLSSYPLLFAGIGRIVIVMSGKRWRDVCTDAGIVAIVAGLGIWQYFVINPGTLDQGPLAQRVVLAVYPMADTLIVATMIGLVLLPRRASAPLVMLMTFALFFLASDIFFNYVVLHPWSFGYVVSDALYLVTYALMASSALVAAGARQIPSESPSELPTLPYGRVALLGAALIGAPTLAVVTAAQGNQVQAPLYVIASIVIASLVLARMMLLLRSLSVEQRRLRAAETKLAFRASHDELTGLPNRAHLLECLRTALADPTPHPLALMFIDLDNFKFVNDSLGHGAGDALLRAVAGRIQGNVRQSALVARLGGDEFVVVTDYLDSADGAEEIANRIVGAFRMPFTIGDDTVFTSPSIGVVYRTDQIDPSALLRDADIALFEAKGSGRGCARLFDTSMRAWAEERGEIESGLRTALDNGELTLVYQPRIDLQTGVIESFEALLRWPAKPNIPTTRVIEIAETTGLIDDIGAFVLDRATQDLRHRFMPVNREIGVAINVSMRQLAQVDFTRDVASALDRNGIPPQRLSIELTETFLSEEPGRAKTTLQRLRDLGVRVEVDDFGVGHSSLSRLAEFPIDGVKIDRGFISAIDDDSVAEAMVVAIVALGRALDLVVTAEGIETPRQAETAHRLGCDVGQGFLFSTPLGLEDAVALLEPRTPFVGIEDWPGWSTRTATPAMSSRSTPPAR